MESKGESSNSRSQSKDAFSKDSKCDDAKTSSLVTSPPDESKDYSDFSTEEEFNELLHAPLSGSAVISHKPHAKRIVNGLTINCMLMKDALSGRTIWESKRWDKEQMYQQEMTEYIPKEILLCKAVAREINFTSMEQLDKFRIEQRVYFHGKCIEEWFFIFGFVIPGSTNTWQQIIAAAPPDKLIPAEVLSGNVTFETSFYDDQLFLCKNLVRIYYA